MPHRDTLNTDLMLSYIYYYAKSIKIIKNSKRDLNRRKNVLKFYIYSDHIGMT